MAEPNRRTVLRGAGIGVAAVAASVMVPNAAFAASPGGAGGSSREADTGPEPQTRTLVVHVKDAARGEMTVMAGDREVAVTDRKLAQRLARLAD